MIVNVPLRDQQTEVGSNGQTSPNKNDNCIPTDIAAMLTALTGRDVNGVDIFDAVYGANYIGMQDPARYVTYTGQEFKCSFTPTYGDAGIILNTCLTRLRVDASPSLVAIPSDWNDEPPHSTFVHMVSICDYDETSDAFTAMNPFGGFYQTQSRAWWIERINACAYKVLWTLTKEGPMSGIPAGWHDDGSILTAPNGHRVVRGFRDHILAADWPAALQPVNEEYASQGNIVEDFTLSLEWNSTHPSIDHVWESAGPNYIDQENALQAKLAQAQQQINDLSHASSARDAIIALAAALKDVQA